MNDYYKEKWFDFYKTGMLELSRAAMTGRISDARGAFLSERGLGDFPVEARVQDADAEGLVRTGTLIGRYQLLQKVGEGGMGEGWQAEQKEPMRRVAIKLIKAGMNTREVMARFESERQALALMIERHFSRISGIGRPFARLTRRE